MNRFDRERWDTMGKEALSRVEELMNTSRINDLIHKREEDEKKKNCILWVLAIIGAVAAVALLPVSSYRPAAFVVQSRKFHLADYQVLLPLTPSNPPKTGLVWRLPPDISCAS